MALSETDAETLNQLLPSFSLFSEQDAKTLSEVLTSVVLAKVETKRVHAEMPALSNNLRAVSLRRKDYADVHLCEFWTNRGMKYDVVFEIQAGSETPKLLSMRLFVWTANARQLTGCKGEDRVEISAKYSRQGEEELEAKMHAGDYSDPGDDWVDYESTGMRALFEKVAVDLGLITIEDDGKTSSNSLEKVKQLMSALISSKVAARTVREVFDEETCKTTATITVLDVMFEDLKYPSENF